MNSSQGWESEKFNRCYNQEQVVVRKIGVWHDLPNVHIIIPYATFWVELRTWDGPFIWTGSSVVVSGDQAHHIPYAQIVLLVQAVEQCSFCRDPLSMRRPKTHSGMRQRNRVVRKVARRVEIVTSWKSAWKSWRSPHRSYALARPFPPLRLYRRLLKHISTLRTP